jgi:tetratricopeptide (TPR) repeat protein
VSTFHKANEVFQEKSSFRTFGSQLASKSESPYHAHKKILYLFKIFVSERFRLCCFCSMSNEEFVQLKQNVGGLISFNSFLSTSADEHVSLHFALSSLDDPNLKAIFYVINVDLTLTSGPVGYLNGSSSYFYEEQEYLWGMNAIFRISEIREVESGVCQVNLIVTSGDDSQLRHLTDYMRREVGILSGMQRLGNLMIEMGEWSKAKDIYETLLEEEEDPCIIQQLGFIAHRMGDLDGALRHFRHALSVFATLLSPNDPELATIYSNVGCVLKDKGRLEEALKQFKRTLELQRSVRKPNKLHIVCSLSLSSISVVSRSFLL